ncbi:hypothetical protein [Rugamonas sp. DEMB1]|uniref:hypothetical protein n=1 Tax=Rugamonas sp. DEMB1 TaxID=3039386 RepID=UPI00244C94CE|nr:hypothetical protein [Rugamonas sp. DEMB1]WGG51837.1 hypothetical protein QC826_06355 [Rugamonas sp. DEMB1]
MSVLGELAGGAVVGGIWKVAAIVLLAALPLVGGGAGAGWWLAAHDRDQARADLATERTRADALTAGIREQNRAVEAMASAKAAADARGQAAQQLSAENGRRFDGALAQLAGRRATTCDEAMPAVNQLLESVR